MKNDDAGWLRKMQNNGSLTSVSPLRTGVDDGVHEWTTRLSSPDWAFKQALQLETRAR